MKTNEQTPEPLVRSDGVTVDLHSMFTTIQGEGPHAGRRAVFIRLAGCNLQCPQCDTQYTQGRRLRHAGELADDAAHMWATMAGRQPAMPDAPLAVLTGGEPFRQQLSPLLRHLINRGFRVQIETNGVYGTQGMDMAALRQVDIVCSPKTHFVHPSIAAAAMAFKYVGTAGELSAQDGLPLRALGHHIGGGKILWRPPIGYPPSNTYLQPTDEKDDSKNQKNLAAVIQSCMAHGYRLCIQTHKLAGLE